MINNIVIIIKKRIGGKYATLLGDFALESSENNNSVFFSESTLLTLLPSNGQTDVAQSFFCLIILKVF